VKYKIQIMNIFPVHHERRNLKGAEMFMGQ